MKVVRTVGQAFDLCQKRTSDSGAHNIADDAEKVDNGYLSPTSSIRSKQRQHSSLSLSSAIATPCDEEEMGARAGDAFRPSTSTTSAGPAEISQQQLFTLTENQSTRANGKVPSRKTSPVSAGQLESSVDLIRPDRKGIQMSTSLIETGAQLPSPFGLPASSSASYYQPTASTNIPQALSYSGTMSTGVTPVGIQPPWLQFPESLQLQLHSPLAQTLFPGPFFDPFSQQQSQLLFTSPTFTQQCQLFSPMSGTESKQGSGSSPLDAAGSSNPNAPSQEGVIPQGPFSPMKQAFSNMKQQQQINALYQNFLLQQQMIMLGQQRGGSQHGVMSASWAEGSSHALSPTSLSHNVEGQSISLLRNQLEFAQRQAQVSIAHVYLLRDQLASETTARIEAQSRTQQLLQSNKELVEQVQMLVARLQNLETRLSLQVTTPDGVSNYAEKGHRSPRNPELPQASARPSGPTSPSRLSVPDSMHVQQYVDLPARLSVDTATSPRSSRPQSPRFKRSDTADMTSTPQLSVEPTNRGNCCRSPLKASFSYDPTELNVQVDKKLPSQSPSRERPAKVGHRRSKWESFPEQQEKHLTRKTSDSVLAHKNSSSSRSTKSAVELLDFDSSRSDEVRSSRTQTILSPTFALSRVSPRNDNSNTIISRTLHSSGMPSLKITEERNNDNDSRTIEPYVARCDDDLKKSADKKGSNVIGSSWPLQKPTQSTEISTITDRKKLAKEVSPSMISPSKSKRKAASNAGLSVNEKALHRLTRQSTFGGRDIEEAVLNHTGPRHPTYDDLNESDLTVTFSDKVPPDVDSSSSDDTCVAALPTKGFKWPNHIPMSCGLQKKLDQPSVIGNPKNPQSAKSLHIHHLMP